jgi:hypothetical protein
MFKLISTIENDLCQHIKYTNIGHDLIINSFKFLLFGTYSSSLKKANFTVNYSANS